MNTRRQPNNKTEKRGTVSIKNNENPTTKTQRKEKNTMSSKNNNNTTKNNERELEQTREQDEANDAVSVSADEFNALGKAVATSATSATESMLDQAQLVFETSEKYKANRFDTVLINFRRKTDLNSASKWCQFRTIGRSASELRPVASKLPSGWTSLSALASALKRKDKNGDPITIETLLMAEDENGSTRLNGYSTQSEVRSIVNQAQGKPARKGNKDAPPPTLTVACGIDAQTVSNEDIEAVEQFLRDALKEFRFIADIEVKQNKILITTLEAQMKKAA